MEQVQTRCLVELEAASRAGRMCSIRMVYALGLGCVISQRRLCAGHRLRYPSVTPPIWLAAAAQQGTDGGVVKKLLREGAGWEQPEKGDKVQGKSCYLPVACLAPIACKQCPPGAITHGAVSAHCLGLGADTRRRALQCTMSVRWRLMAASLIHRGSGTSPSASRWGKVGAGPA